MSALGSFKMLKPTEYHELIQAIPKVCILIAGADGEIDLKEKAWAEKIVSIRSFAYTHELKPIYLELKDQYVTILNKLVDQYPKDHVIRNKQISKELMVLNTILPKLKLYVASQYYDSLIDLAEEVAKASGGFLRMGAINNDENVWLGLPMLDPIFYDELFEEE